jgi:hypothetical protein
MLLAAASLLFASTAVAEEGEMDSWDGRNGTSCSTYVTVNAAVCAVPFGRLIAEPERFEGRFVLLTGYVEDRAGKTTLFPSRESGEEDIAIEGVVLTDAPKDMRRTGRWVTVTGRFDAGSGDRPHLGMLHEVRDAAPVGAAQ